MDQSLKDLYPPSYAAVPNVLEEELAKEHTEPTDRSRFRVMELEHIRHDGSEGWAEVKVSFLRDEADRPLRELYPLEIRVADLIRDGKTIKEIAQTFGVSDSAINQHRQHSRNKL